MCVDTFQHRKTPIMMSIVKQARLFQTYRKFFGWDDEAVHFEIGTYTQNQSPSTSGNVVLFSEDGSCALRYSGDTVVFLCTDQVGTVVSAMARAATQVSVTPQEQLVVAALGKPKHPAGQWARFLYLTAGHMYEAEAMLACHARSEQTTNCASLAFDVAKNGLLPNVYASTANNWPGGQLVEYTVTTALPSVLDGPVFVLLDSSSNKPSMLVARSGETSGVCFFVGKVTDAGRQAAYKALQRANEGRFIAAWSDVAIVTIPKEASGSAMVGLFAALLAVDPTWSSSDDVARICASMDFKANAAALASITRILEPCSSRLDRSSLGQRVRETELENTTLKNQLKIKDNKIAALTRRIKKLGEEASAAQTASAVLRVKLEAATPPARLAGPSNVMRLTDISKNELVPMKSPASWASGNYQKAVIYPPFKYPMKLMNKANTSKTALVDASIRVKVFASGPLFNATDAFLCTLSNETNFERFLCCVYVM